METTTKKYATLQQLSFQRRNNRRELENDIKDVERQFKYCSKVEEPGRWFTLQDELGELYKKLINSVKPP